MMNPSGQFTSIGGQAVIEGVMMRSPHFLAVAIRKPNQRIVIRKMPFLSIGQKYPILKKPILRGILTLIESMIQGVDALSYSAQMNANSEEVEEKLSSWAIAASMVTAVFFGMGLFVVLPHFITVLLTSRSGLGFTAQSPFFHLLDGGFKICILLVYVYIIALMKDVHRVFQYHGAEHKSIYAFEAGEELTVENARKFSTLHPRCGTSFLFFLVLISVGVFSILFPVLHLTQVFVTPLFNHAFMILVKSFLMLPVAGLAYEFIKQCSLRMNSPLFRALILPGLLLQKLTTREPTDDQLEVALASLKQVLKLEKEKETGGTIGSQEAELEILDLSELGVVKARVAEFPEI